MDHKTFRAHIFHYAHPLYEKRERNDKWACFESYGHLFTHSLRPRETTVTGLVCILGILSWLHCCSIWPAGKPHVWLLKKIMSWSATVTDCIQLRITQDTITDDEKKRGLVKTTQSWMLSRTIKAVLIVLANNILKSLHEVGLMNLYDLKI